MNRQLVSLALVFASATGIASAAPAPTQISVGGYGSVSMVPDEATVNAQIQTAASTSSAAVSENNQRYERIVAAIIRTGVKRDDVTLSYYNVSYQPKPNPMPANPDPYARYGYTVTRSFAIKVRQMDRAGAVVDAATAAGATSIEGVSFDLSKPESARAKATREAVADARTKAEELAAAAGLHITGIASISLEGAPSVRPLAMAKTMAGPAAPTAFDTGSVNVTSNVTVIFSATP